MEQQEQKQQKRQEDAKHKEDNTMKEKREVDLSQKGTLEAFELSDDDMEQVIGGMMNKQVYASSCIYDCKGKNLSTCEYFNCPYNHK